MNVLRLDWQRSLRVGRKILHYCRCQFPDHWPQTNRRKHRQDQSRFEVQMVLRGICSVHQLVLPMCGTTGLSNAERSKRVAQGGITVCNVAPARPSSGTPTPSSLYKRTFRQVIAVTRQGSGTRVSRSVSQCRSHSDLGPQREHQTQSDPTRPRVSKASVE